MMVAWQTGKRRRDARRGPLSVPLALETVGCAEPAVPTNPTAFFFLETQASNYTGSSVFCRRQPGILTSGIGMTEQPGAPERAVGAHKKRKQQLSAAFRWTFGSWRVG